MMQNGKGDPVTVNTQWTASIYDSSWFFDPKMALTAGRIIISNYPFG